MFIRLTDQISVAPQIAPEDCAVAKGEGFTAIINNRPDGEVPGQPSCAQMRAAAEAAGLRYCAIPIDQSGFSLPQIEAMAAELGAGPVLAFCRSGTRSTNLWALAERQKASTGPPAPNSAAPSSDAIASICGIEKPL